MTNQTQLPILPHFDRRQVGEVWRVLYQDRAAAAKTWAKGHKIPPAAQEKLSFVYW